MVQCKKDGCREPAVPYGKRYCKAHMAEYKEKRRKYDEIRRSLPECTSGVSSLCDGKVGPHIASQGGTVCAHCQREIDAAVEAQRDEDYAIEECVGRAMGCLSSSDFTPGQLMQLRAAFKELICDG